MTHDPTRGPGHDPSPSDAALTPEERAFAERLARGAPQRGPSPALDARILEAARTAVQAPAATRTATPRRPRPRWPMITGVAASLMLAFGMVWQLRPTTHLEAASAPAPAFPERRSGGGGPSAADDVAAPTEDAANAAAPPAAEPAQVVAEAAKSGRGTAESPAAVAPRRQEAQTASAPASPPAEADAAAEGSARPVASGAPAPAPAPPPPPAQAQAIAAPLPPPAADAAPEAFGRTQQTDRGDDRGDSEARAPAANANADAARERSAVEKRRDGDAGTLDRVEVTGSRNAPQAAAESKAADKATAAGGDDGFLGGSDQPLDNEPPASAGAPAVRDAWLKRVRDLLAHGERDAARDSLREYQRRNPDARIPDDLQPLLSE